MCPSCKMQDVTAFLHRAGQEMSLSVLRKEMIFLSCIFFKYLVLLSGYRFFFLLPTLNSLKTDVPDLNFFRWPFVMKYHLIFLSKCILLFLLSCFLESLQNYLSLVPIIRSQIRMHLWNECLCVCIYIYLATGFNL